MEKILTVNEVAQILSVKPITVREMFRENRLRAFKIGKAWRTTETMLAEDIAAMAKGAAPASSGTVSTPKRGDDMAKSKDRAKASTKMDESAEPETHEAVSADTATEYPESETPSQDTADPRWMAPAGKLDSHPDVAIDSDESLGVPLSTPTKLMNRQEQISGAKQRETQIPPESERKAEENKSKKKKKARTEQDQFEFDDIQ